MIQLLGIQVANGYSPEARVFATLLRHSCRNQVRPSVLFHEWSGDLESTRRFLNESSADVYGFDFGWRSTSTDRKISEKVWSRYCFYRALPRALAIARKLNPDVIYSSQQLWDCQVATYIAKRLRKPQIIHLHCAVSRWLHRPVLQRLLTCDQVLTVSDFVRDQVIHYGVPEERVATVYNSVVVQSLPKPGTREAVRQELGLPLDAPVIGIVGRIDPQKGHVDVLKALALVVQNHPETRLVIVGSETPWFPNYMDELKTLIKDSGISSRVLFLGHRGDVWRLLTAMDVFIHPSRQEGFGMAVAEASAARLPVIAYADGGITEIVTDGITGALAEPGDIPSMAKSLSYLIENPSVRDSWGEQGRHHIMRKFSPDVAARAFSEAVSKY